MPALITSNPTWKAKRMKWENSLYLGVELELEQMDPEISPAQEAAVLEKINNFLNDGKMQSKFNFKYDGSLKRGVEIVSHPMTLQYFHNRIPWKDFFEMIKKEKLLYADNTCGLHVHLTKKFFTKLELVKLRMFFSQNRDQLTKFSRRCISKLERWCKLEKGYDVKTFLQGTRSGSLNNPTRGNALAIYSNHPETIEIRLFRSTNKHDELLASLQFCDAVAYFVKDYSIASVAKENCWKDFIQWCKKQNRYNHFLLKAEKL